MIRFDRVSKRYPGTGEALSNLSFELPAGGMAFLTGHSGAGKSTLLRLAAGLETASNGVVTVGGVNPGRLSKRRIPLFRRRLGIIFQDHHLLTDRTALDNVLLPLIVSGMNHRDATRRARAALDKVGLLNKERCRPETLSAGEQQRVGIARAVVNRPRVLLADEPTGNLDPELSREVMQLFEQFNRVGVTVLIASHDLDLIRGLGHPLLRLTHGRLEPDQMEPDQQDAVHPANSA